MGVPDVERRIRISEQEFLSAVFQLEDGCACAKISVRMGTATTFKTSCASVGGKGCDFSRDDGIWREWAYRWEIILMRGRHTREVGGAVGRRTCGICVFLLLRHKLASISQKI